ncbi:hypothetical protein [Caenimonas sp. SL110]|uniref:hypothetical protein n=1 Tax=Caenimonas sp. SL110 TaxID=1450524 RepID=UPI0006540FBB|nr:hypothetical protein [Caenimonas sp. SL110]
MIASSAQRPAPTPPISSTSQPPTFSANAFTAGISFCREAITQPPAKVLGLTALWASHYAWSSGHDPSVVGLVISAGLSAGALVGWKLASHEFGADTAGGKVASGMAALAAGVVVAGTVAGNAPIALAAETSIALGAIGLLAARLHARRTHQDVRGCTKAAVIASAIALAIAAYCALGSRWPGELKVVRLGGATDGFLVARQCGSLVEALAVELAKDAASTCGPTADPKALTLEARMHTLVKALLPYLGVCIAVNGVLAPSMLPGDDGVSAEISFAALLPSVLATCITNMARNGLNTAAVLSEWTSGRRSGVPENPREYSGGHKTMMHRTSSMVDRSAARYFLMAARTTTYVLMRTHGFSIVESALAAQAKFALFNQFREVVGSLMAGESWTPEVPAEITGHEPCSRIDLDDIEACFDADETEREFQEAMEQARRSQESMPAAVH